MTNEKLSDTLDKKMLDLNFKILAFLASILIRPLAFCTEAIFRRNFGERYFTLVTVTYSFFLWCIPALFLDADGGVQWTFLYRHGWTHVAQWLTHQTSPKTVMFCISAVFFFSASKNYAQIRMRQAKGIAWYSMSRGESIFGTESLIVKGFYSGLICVVLCILSPALGLFFFLSRAAGFVLWQKEQESIYARYLDEQDARIMAGNLEPAMLGNKPTRETSGLYCPLPKRFTGEHRAHVAKVSGGVMARSTARNATEREPQSGAGDQSAESVKSGPAEELRRMVNETFPRQIMSQEQFKKLWSMGLKIRRLFVPVLLVIAACLLVFVSYKFITSHHKTEPSSAPVVSQTASTTIPQANTSAAVSAVQVQPPAAIPANPPPAAAVVQVPPAALVVATPTVETAQVQPAQTGTQPNYAAALYPQNDTASSPPLTGLAGAVDGLNSFSNYCAATLIADNDRIGQLPNKGVRYALTEKSVKIQSAIDKMIADQGQYLESLAPGTEADASVERSTPPMNMARQSATNALSRLDIQIQNAWTH
jgi:hypothetical protein